MSLKDHLMDRIIESERFYNKAIDRGQERGILDFMYKTYLLNVRIFNSLQGNVRYDFISKRH